MKKLLYKKAHITLALLASILLLSCLKDKGWENGEYGSINSNTEGGKFVSVRTGSTANVTRSSIRVDYASADVLTVPVDIDVDFMNPTTEPITVKLTIDNSKVASYNNEKGTDFLVTTPAMAKLTSTTVTIPAGERTASTTLEIAQDQYDPSKSYMIPVTITEVSGGFKLSSNLSTRWFNVIGNPIAGNYDILFSRWLKADSVGGQATSNYYHQNLGGVEFGPLTPTKIQTEGVFGDVVFIDFTNNNGVLSDFNAYFRDNEAELQGLPAWGPAKVEAADPVNGYYKIVFTYQLASGAIRYIVYEYVKQ